MSETQVLQPSAAASYGLYGQEPVSRSGARIQIDTNKGGYGHPE